jgi:hypothetical protein
MLIIIRGVNSVREKAARTSTRSAGEVTHPSSAQTLQLPSLGPVNESTTSLLEAVIGRIPSPTLIPETSIAQGSAYRQTRSQSTTSSSTGQHSASASASDGTTFGTNTEGEWDVLSDASLRVNRGEQDEVVEELQKKVDKR